MRPLVCRQKSNRNDGQDCTHRLRDSSKQAFTEVSPHSTPILREDESSLAEESNAILDYRIGIIQTTIQKARTIPDDTKAELLTLFTGLNSELAVFSKTHHEDASSITRFADVSAHEASRSQNSPQLAKTALDGLRASIQGLEDSHPVLAGTASRFATALSNMGI